MSKPNAPAAAREKNRGRCRSGAGSFDMWMKAADDGRSRGPMNTEIALAMDALAFGRPVDGFDARDRRIIGSVVRALQRLLESDGMTPAHEEDRRAQIVVQGGKVLLLAAVSTKVMGENDHYEAPRDARSYRLPPLETKQQRTFAFG
jgi:hypothetical protein